MIMTPVLIVASLGALNFILLVFSCNKITSTEITEVKPMKQSPILTTSQLDSNQLSPTGS